MVFILSQPVQNMIQVLLAVAAITSAFVAVRSMRNVEKQKLAKQKDLDTTTKIVMDHDKRIGEIEKGHPFKAYVDQQDRAIQHRIDNIEKRADENIRELHSDVKEILKLLAK